MNMARHSTSTTTSRALSHGFCWLWIGPRMRSRMSCGSWRAMISAEARPKAPLPTSSTHASGQSSVPADRNRMAPSITSQMTVCTISRRISDVIVLRCVVIATPAL